MKNKLIFLTLVFASFVGVTTKLNAEYWVDEYDYRHDGVVSGSAHVAGNAVEDTGDFVGDLFGGRRHYCRHHPSDRACR